MVSEGARAPNVVEDVFEGQATGVEVEQISPDDTRIERPWNPEHIRVTTSAFSLRNILDQIDEKSLELAPDFQRGMVWKAQQKSLLVESLLLQIPLPAFYFAEGPDGVFHVVDGLQRLSTLHSFVRGREFSLRSLEYLHDANGCRFNDLDMQWQRRINNTQLTVNVIDPTTPPDVMYDIFKRINTGGTPLNAQEIRHCMSRPRSRAILKRMTHSAEFSKATNGLTDHVRMNDREMALRFVAFHALGLDEYMANPAMESFLMHATRLLDDPVEFPDVKVETLERAFVRATSNAFLVFGEHAFRKWPIGAHGRSPINRALFETWSIAMVEYDADDLARRRLAIETAARRRMTDDILYLDSITSSTADRRRVAYRFNAARVDARAGL